MAKDNGADDPQMKNEHYRRTVDRKQDIEGSNNLIHGFEPGDMVWGKVKSHPWWPGQVYNEALVSKSVRRTKREGYVLVAFFGDSSYGWFDPAELIPFEPNYDEKSRQSASKTFAKAVEDAVDEASRRQALGLICNCKKPSIFRPSGVNGYFVVDSDDYEPGCVYSANQIKKSRDNFCPSETVSFIHQLALQPTTNGDRGIYWIKNISRVLAYRKAIFEEFDETYAQAFGVDPINPSQDPLPAVEQCDRVQTRAPFTGPLVIAESLGERRSSKSAKSKNLLKEKYVLKRRELPDVSGSTESSSMLTTNTRSSSGDLSINRDFDMPLAANVETEDEDITIASLLKSSVIRDIGDAQSPRSVEIDIPKCKPSNCFDGPQHTESTVIEQEASQLQMPSPLLEVSSIQAADADATFKIPDSSMPKSPDAAMGDKPFVGERSVEGPSNNVLSETFDKKEKRKRKKTSEGERETIYVRKSANMQETVLCKENTGEPIGMGTTPDIKLEDVRVEEETIVSPSRLASSASLQELELGNVDLAELVGDLLCLALDPFHERGSHKPVMVQHVFLNFRSLVFEKSLSSPSADEAGLVEKPEAESMSKGVSNLSIDVQDQDIPKQLKFSSRLEDPTRMGRKRATRDRQAEKLLKRERKMKALKSLTSEKKTASQLAFGKKGDRVEANAQATGKSIKQDALKKDGPAAKLVEPTSLTMKFPPSTQLPSIPQLNALFVRFGPLDIHSTRVYWKTSSCRVVFKHKSDAQAACNHAMRTNSLFGSVQVSYRVAEVPKRDPPELLERNKQGDAMSELSFMQSSESDFLNEPKFPLQQHQTMPVQLKSCLKRSSGEDLGQPLAKENRVKFLLDADGANSKSSSNNGEAWLNSTSYLVVNNSNGFQPSLGNSLNLPPVSSVASQISSATAIEKTGNVEIGPIVKLYPDMHTSQGKEELVDISCQMLSLLMRCNDIVMNVKCRLGHTPYRPL